MRKEDGFEGGGERGHRRGGNGGDGEEAGGLPIADEIRSLLALARTADRARRALFVDLTISRFAARCWYSKTLSGDERHYPHRGR